ncbi:MAG: hypothetical protein AB8G95_04050 [Anaerolineae bacterium]
MHHISAGDFSGPVFWLGLESLALGIAALILLFRPQDGRLIVATAVLQLINIWMLAPFIANHWVLGALVSLAIVVSAVGAGFYNTCSELTWADRFFTFVIPSTLLILIASYPFAAFAKWNSAFLNPDVSCAVDIFVRGYELFGLDQLAQFLAVRWGLIVIGLASETIIAILILVPRTRAWGAFIGLFFHFVVAFDPIIPFFDFSSILFLFFVLCLPVDIIEHLVDQAESQFAARWKKIVAVGMMALILFVPLIDQEGARLLFALGRQGIWLFFSIAILVWVFKRMALDRRQLSRSILIWPEKHDANGRFGRIQKAILVTLLCCTLSIGLSPWFEIQTGYGLVMYSNLLTAGGETNHLLIPKTFPIGQGYFDLIEVTASNSNTVQDFYIDSGWQVPAVSVRRTLAQYPNVDAEIIRDGMSSTISNEVDLFEPLPLFQQKLQNLRPVDLHQPTRCQLATHPLQITD